MGGMGAPVRLAFDAGFALHPTAQHKLLLLLPDIPEESLRPLLTAVQSSPVVKGLGPVAIVANARSRLGDEAGQASAYASGTPRSTGATPRAAARRGVPAEL